MEEFPAGGGSMREGEGVSLQAEAQETKLWAFEEPICSEGTSRTLRVLVRAPKDLSPQRVYMLFGQIKETSGTKRAQYQKHYGNVGGFMKSFNLRFGTSHSIGVLTRMMKQAREERQQKKAWAMAVKIVREEAFSVEDDGVEALSVRSELPPGPSRADPVAEKPYLVVDAASCASHAPARALLQSARPLTLLPLLMNEERPGQDAAANAVGANGPYSRSQQLICLTSADGVLLGEKLGRGLYGEVYKASLEGAGWPPALCGVDLVAKLFKDDINRVRMGGANRARIYEEFLIGAIQHHSLVTCLAFTRVSPFLALFERCNRGSLQDALKLAQNGEEALSEKVRANALELVIQLLEGICFLHKSNVLHNDLHCGNVLLHETSGNLTLRIGDFGFCCNATEGRFAELVSLRKREEFSVRHPHVAPELLRGESYSKATDIWAVGYVIKEIVGLNQFTCNPIPGVYRLRLTDKALTAVVRCSYTRLNPQDRPSADDLLNVFRAEV